MDYFGPLLSRLSPRCGLETPNLGVVIALATLINLVIAAFAGVFLPIILDKLGIDPALAGGVALTTVTDVVGYFAVLGLAATLLF